MPIILKPRKQQFYILIGTSVFLFLGFISLLLLNLTSSSLGFETTILYATGTVITAGLTYKMRYLYKIQMIKLFDDQIQIVEKNMTHSIPFKDISSVKLKSKVNYSFEILNPIKNIHINYAHFDKSELIIEKFCKARPDIFVTEDLAKIRSYYLVASVGKKDNYAALWLAIALIAAAFVLTYILQAKKYSIEDFGVYFDISLTSLLALPTLFIVCPVIGFNTRKIREDFQTRLLINPFDTQRNKNLAKSLLKQSVAILSISLFCYYTVVYKYDLNFLDYTEVASDIPSMNFKGGEIIWIDGRYRCLSCNYQLTKDSPIVYSYRGDYVAFISALPGEAVSINTDSRGRKMASEQTIILKPDQIAVRSGITGGIARAIKVNNVRGKIINFNDFF